MFCNKSDSDKDLVKASLESPDCFAYLLGKHKDGLARFIKRISNSADEEIEDILQEVFIQVYINLADFDERMSFSAWIYKIARNKTIDYFRKAKSRPYGNYISASEEFVNHIAKSDDDLQEFADKKTAIKKLQEAMNKLSKTEKEILLLRFFEEKSYLEISDILQIPTGTVSTMIHRAKEKLKNELKNYKF